jgi:tetratricopeptide (TPR) repeat protein
MKLLKTSIAMFLIFSFALIAFVTLSYAQNQQVTLNQYVADLQNNPTDNALREKIIKYVQGMKQKPVIPREAERFMNRGAAAVKSAKGSNDFRDAVAEFEKAALSAPWLANAYYNLGVAQDKAGLYAEAMRSLKLYLLAAPAAPDKNVVEKLIDEIEYRQEKAAKESSPEAVALKKQNEYESRLKKLNGSRFVWHFNDNGWGPGYYTLDVQGNKLIWGGVSTRCAKEWCPWTVGQWYPLDEATVNNTDFIFPKDCWGNGSGPHPKGKINDDGYSITLEMCQGLIGTYIRER